MNKSLLHTPEGVRDVYGEEYARKLFVEKKLHDTIHLYGYQDIQTPTFEFFDVYSKEIGTTGFVPWNAEWDCIVPVAQTVRTWKI